VEDLTRHDEYYASNKWRCTLSPSGAHYWVEIGFFRRTGHFYCKYCYDAREFPTHYNESANFTHPNTVGHLGGLTSRHYNLVVYNDKQ
jgi:hypothetical protein